MRRLKSSMWGEGKVEVPGLRSRRHPDRPGGQCSVICTLRQRLESFPSNHDAEPDATDGFTEYSSLSIIFMQGELD